MSGNRTIRGLAVEYYGSLTNLALALRWSYSKVSRIANGQQEPSVSDIRELAKALRLETADDIVSVFSLV